MLGERPDGKWSAFEAGLIVPRQNGKGSVLEAIELAGLILFGERLILHTAHEYKTASEAFLRIQSLLENTDDLRKKVKNVRTANGEQGIEMRSGQRLRFIARSAGSGRGFSGDRIILDEAYNLPRETMQALLPTMAARPNPQIIYASSAGDSSSVHLGAVRERAKSGDAGRLCWLEWSVPDSSPPDAQERDLWAQANPALGFRITEEFIEAELAAMSADGAGFARERLGYWDSGPGGQASVFSSDLWQTRYADLDRIGRPAFAVAISTDRSWSAIASSGRGPSVPYVDAFEHREGTSWLLDRLIGLDHKHRPRTVMVAADQGGSLADGLMAEGIDVIQVSAADTRKAWAAFKDEVRAGRVTHRGGAALNHAVAGAVERQVGESLALDRSGSTDVSPLAAASLALWAHTQTESGGLQIW